MSLETIGQKFLCELLTDLGSVAWQRNRGTRFLKRLQVAKTEFDVFGAWNSEQNRMRRRLRAQTGGLYVNASLEKILLSSTGELRLGFMLDTKLGSFYVETPPLRRST